MIVKAKDYEALEAKADALIHRSLEGVTKYSEKADILTPWKEWDRKRHEVLTPSGQVSPTNRQGTYGRAANYEHPHLNSREGLAGLLTHKPDLLHAWKIEQGRDWVPTSPPESER